MNTDKPSNEPRRAPIRLRTVVTMIIALVAGGFFAARFLRPQVDAEPIDLPVVTRLGDTKTEGGSDSDDPGTGQNADGTASTQPPTDVSNLPLPQRISQAAIDQAEHPFDPLLVLAESCIEKIDAEVKDYSAVMTSQVRIDGVLREPRKLFCKIRHPQPEPNKCSFSVYTRFMEPTSIKGQEAIWVDGWNDGNIVAHITGFANLKRFYLKPDSSYAMEGNLHPISDIGFRQLMAKICLVAKKEREHGECTVTVTKDLLMDGRKCTLLEAKHPVKRDHFEFHIARIYIDDEREIPLAYEGYTWPEEPDGEPVLVERYYYSDIQCNIGLKDIDFDPANEDYGYPGF